MKKEIHPKYFDNAKVTCSCGASFEVGSTVAETKVEICSNCHPAYTGNKKYIDTAGRLDKFKSRMEKSEQLKKEIVANKAKSSDKKSTTEEAPEQTEN
jgi:large subunit ribosomal protein L31